MKIKMILSSLSLILFACNSDNAPTVSSTQTTDTDKDSASVQTEISELNGLLKKYEEPSQNFEVPSGRISEVKGKAGTKIKIDPHNLVAEDAQPLGKTIEVELKELTSTAQLLKNNAATMSDGKLLISGGAYYINMTSDGRQLKIKSNSSLEIEFPKLTDQNMTLFTGARDSLGNMNWTSTSEAFAKQSSPPQKRKPAKKDTSSPAGSIIEYLKDGPKFTEDEKKEMDARAKVYEAMNIRAFGWINCDRFASFPDKTNIAIAMRPQDSISSANLYLVFNDIRSVMQAEYYCGKKYSFNYGFINVPVGRSVKLIAHTIKHGKMYSYSSDLSIKPNEKVTIEFKPTSSEDFGKLLSLN